MHLRYILTWLPVPPLPAFVGASPWPFHWCLTHLVCWGTRYSSTQEVCQLFPSCDDVSRYPSCVVQCHCRAVCQRRNLSQNMGYGVGRFARRQDCHQETARVVAASEGGEDQWLRSTIRIKSTAASAIADKVLTSRQHSQSPAFKCFRSCLFLTAAWYWKSNPLFWLISISYWALIVVLPLLENMRYGIEVAEKETHFCTVW